MGRCAKSVLMATNLSADDEDGEVLPESVSITRVDDLLAQMRFHEVPKRALFSVPFQLAKDFAIGIKGFVEPRWYRVLSWLTLRFRYGLVTEQKKGSYRYFVDLGDRMAPVVSRTTWQDPVSALPIEVSCIFMISCSGWRRDRKKRDPLRHGSW